MLVQTINAVLVVQIQNSQIQLRQNRVKTTNRNRTQVSKCDLNDRYTRDGKMDADLKYGSWFTQFLMLRKHTPMVFLCFYGWCHFDKDKVPKTSGETWRGMLKRSDVIS